MREERSAKVEEIIGKMVLRFTSRNDVPVGRAHVSHAEWTVLEAYIRNLGVS